MLLDVVIHVELGKLELAFSFDREMITKYFHLCLRLLSDRYVDVACLAYYICAFESYSFIDRVLDCVVAKTVEHVFST